MSEYLLLVLDSLTITQIKPVMYDLTPDNKQLYHIDTQQDAQNQFLFDSNQNKVMVLQLLLELGWVLRSDDIAWLQEEYNKMDEKYNDVNQNLSTLIDGIDNNTNNNNNNNQNALNPNKTFVNQSRGITNPNETKPTSISSLNLVPSLASTIQIQRANQVPLFPEVRSYLIEQLTKEQRERQLSYISPHDDVNASHLYIKHNDDGKNAGPRIDFNTLSDSELRALISQHHYRIKIIDVYHSNSAQMPRLPRYSVEWIEYHRQVQERLLLQRKEWILKGYSERKINRLSKIAKRKLIYGLNNSANTSSKYNKNGDFNGLFGPDDDIAIVAVEVLS
jgi:hypothetical protein